MIHKSDSTLMSYTKAQLIEEIRCLEHNLMSMEENYNRVVTLNENILNNVPEADKYVMKVFNEHNSNWPLLCKSYSEQMEHRIDYYDITGRPNYIEKTIGRCNGTKEREECSCGGDKSKCDFY